MRNDDTMQIKECVPAHNNFCISSTLHKNNLVTCEHICVLCRHLKKKHLLFIISLTRLLRGPSGRSRDGKSSSTVLNVVVGDDSVKMSSVFGTCSPSATEF
jgi:hypothetical protein